MENKQGWGIRQKERLKSQGIIVVPLPRNSQAKTGSDLIVQGQT